MQRSAVRLAVAITGLILLAMGVAAWIDPTRLAAQLGVGANSALGMATLRADLGAFFAVSGGLALAGAVRRAPRLLTAPALLIGLALAGRCLALLATPFETPMAPPMAAEALMLAALAAGRFLQAAP